MEPFDDKTICPACGYLGAVPEPLNLVKYEISQTGDVDTSFILRKCGRCTYQWKEQPLHLVP